MNSTNLLNIPTSIIKLRLYLFNIIAVAFAFLILPTADITKFIFASASHVIASITFLHPEFAIRALFELSSFHEEHEVFVFFAQICDLLVFFARHILMELALAPQAIIFLAGWAAVLSEFLVKLKYSIATWSGAPTCIFHVFLNIVVESKIFIFVSKIFGKKLVDIILQYFCSAAFLRTGEGDLFADDLFLRIFTKALSVKHVTTDKVTELGCIYFSEADKALNSQIIGDYF